MSSPLAQVTQAAQRKRVAEQHYRDVLAEARGAASVQEIARAAGVSRQSVYKVLNRREKKT